jgi:hypothetical protein
MAVLLRDGGLTVHDILWPADANVSSIANSVLRSGGRPVLLVRREPRAGEVVDGARAGR